MSNRLYNPKKKPRKKEDLKFTDKLEIAGITIAVIALTGWSGYAAVNSFKPIQSAPRYELYMESIQDYVDGEWPEDTPEQTTESATEPATEVTTEPESSTENTSEQEMETNKEEQKEETEQITEPETELETEAESQEQANSESETEVTSEKESEILTETEISAGPGENLSDKAMEAKGAAKSDKQAAEAVKSEANKASKKKTKQLFTDAKKKQEKMTETETESESETESEKAVSYIATGILNIRENPDKGALKIGECAKYSNLTVLEEPNDEHPKWYKIKKGDLTGYVTAEFVEAQPEE